ncbi:hypothetical protein Tco_0904491 [Tanacetum coccineum]
MDWYTKNALWIYWARGDDEVKLTDEETSDSDDNNEVSTIFRIETNVFDFKTPSSKALEFNYLFYKSIQMSLLKVLRDLRLMTNTRMIGFMNGIKMCHGYTKSHGRMLEHGKNPHLLNIIVSLLIIKVDVQNGQPVAGEKICIAMENLHGAYIVGNSLYYQDLEWYEALEDGELKEEALKNKAIMEGIIEEDDESINEGWRRWDGYEITNRDHEEIKFEMEHDNEGRCELFDDYELSVCNIRKFEMIKYSFGDDEKYVAIKKDEYDDLTSTSKDACRVYQEIFRMMDEVWMVTRD